MFAAFDAEEDAEMASSPDVKKDKKRKKNKKKGSKRKPDEDQSPSKLEELEAPAKRMRLEEPDFEEEDDKLRKEGEMMEALLGDSKPSGYDEADFIVETKEYPNCTHEFVSPAGFVRPEFKAPAKRAKEYKFKLDTFQEKAVQCI